MGIFFAIGFGAGGIIAPSIFGVLIDYNDKHYLAIGYYIGRIIKLYKKTNLFYFNILTIF